MLDIQNAAREIVESLATVQKTKATDTTVSSGNSQSSNIWGTVKEVRGKEDGDGTEANVLIDGNEEPTWLPVMSTAIGIQNGYRCRVEIKNFIARVLDYSVGNYDIAAIDSNSTEAITAATTAQTLAEGASSAAATAQSTATTAKNNAATAQSTADTAVTNAANAQSTADTAVTNAATAQSTADSASSAAATAQSTADNAQTAADAAQESTDNLLASTNEQFASTNEMISSSVQAISGNMTEISSDLDALTNTVGNVQASTQANADAIESLNQSTEASISNIRSDLGNQIGSIAAQFDNLSSFVRIGETTGGQPCLEMGQLDTSGATMPFKSQMTNTGLYFLQDGMSVAYMTNQQLGIQTAVIDGMLNIGSYAWSPRNGGKNMSLKWMGA